MYDQTVHDSIVGMLRAGSFVETAAEACGLEASIVRGWIRLGTEAGSPYAQFRRDALAAIAESEANGIAEVIKAGVAGNARVLIWWLERRHPHRWGARSRNVREELDGILDRIESLEPELGAEVIDRVLGVVAGESSNESGGEAEGAEDPEVH